MKRPSQLYRNLKLWKEGLAVVLEATKVIIAIISLSTMLGGGQAKEGDEASAWQPQAQPVSNSKFFRTQGQGRADVSVRRLVRQSRHQDLWNCHESHPSNLAPKMVLDMPEQAVLGAFALGSYYGSLCRRKAC
jgi:hypothetical protein